jgi:iron complex transport system ATP-binding protein
MSIIETRNMKFKYDGAWVLDGLSFTTGKGEFLSIIGPNGSGKTTLLKVIDGIYPPQQGTIFIDGKDNRRIRRYELAKIIAVVPQDSPMIFSFTVQEVVMMGRAPHLGRLRFEGKSDFDIVHKAMEITDILPFAGRNINELSGGERQRVLIARALAQQPQIILLDESTAFLDIKHQVAFFDLIRMLNRDEGLTVIAVTHDMNLASLYSDRVMLLNHGRIHHIGTPDEVITEPNIREVYETDVLVDRNPVTGLPRVTLLAWDPTD